VCFLFPGNGSWDSQAGLQYGDPWCIRCLRLWIKVLLFRSWESLPMERVCQARLEHPFSPAPQRAAMDGPLNPLELHLCPQPPMQLWHSGSDGLAHRSLPSWSSLWWWNPLGLKMVSLLGVHRT
jgi:hypothetical protein